MINRKQLEVSAKFALTFLIVQMFLKLIHLSSMIWTFSILLAIFHGWLLPLFVVGILVYYLWVTSICYLVCRVLNYVFNLVWR